MTAASAAVQTVTWEAWIHQPGVFDIGGPQSDGKLVLAATGGLFLATAAGQVEPFARGAGGYQAPPPLSEAYIAVSPGLQLTVIDETGAQVRPEVTIEVDP